MKILYLSSDPAPVPKGAGVRIARTVATLRSLGHEVELFTPAAASGEQLPGHDTVELPQENHLERMLAFRGAANEWLSRREGDLVQFRGIWEGVAAVDWARRNGARSIFEAHGFPSIELPYHFPAMDRADGLLDRIVADENALLARVDRLWTPSVTGRRFLLSRGVPAGRIDVIPNAVDTMLFSPLPAPPVDEVPFRLVYVGTMAPWQGLETLVEAMAPLRNRVELQVVGTSKSLWRERLRRLARRFRVQNSVRFSAPTSQENLSPVLRGAHACVAPMTDDARNSVQGCCPIKILEYMACGRPILATSIAPVREILEDGRDARLVRPGSPAALADGLRWMLDHPVERELLGMTAREKARASWSPEVFADRVASALGRLADGQGSGRSAIRIQTDRREPPCSR